MRRVGRLARVAALAGLLFGGIPARGSGADPYADVRERMVAEQLVSGRHGRPIRDARVLAAMRAVPRHEFVPLELRALAYTDQPLPIGDGQTISQPFIVALMTEAAEIAPGERVLEIGTGSGYQAAILRMMTDHVYSIEILESLARRAESTVGRLGYDVRVRAGDGFAGWPEAAPFDAILITAAAPRVPEPLAEQLAEHGRLVMPLEEDWQELVVYTKQDGRLVRESLIPVQFVPMTGRIRSESR